MSNIDFKYIKRIKKGDLAAYEELFTKYYQLLCSYATKYVKDINISEEIVQELFYTIWKNKKDLKITTSVKSYLFKAVQNNCLLIINKKNVENKYTDFVKYNLKYSLEDTLHTVNYNEVNDIINSTLDSLPENCREIFKLSRYEGLKYKDIAQKLSISVKTVEANIGKALKSFRYSLKDYMSIFLIIYYCIF